MLEANEARSEMLNLSKHPIIVMLVDDQPFVAEAIRHQLEEDSEINFHYCAVPDQAISTALEIRPTVILLDMVMPDVDGLALLRYFRSNPETREVPVIVLSSRDEAKVKADDAAKKDAELLGKYQDMVAATYIAQQKKLGKTVTPTPIAPPPAPAAAVVAAVPAPAKKP